MPSNDPEVRALLDSRIDACRAKDIDRLMSLYSPGIVYYNVVPPLQFDGPIGLEKHDLNIAISGDVAFAHMLHLDSGTRKNGIDDPVWARSTDCCRRSSGKWLITHEHISMPGTWPVSGSEGNSPDYGL